ncbi:Glycosyltransferase Family 90 domain containing protein [Ascochyta lentis]
MQTSVFSLVNNGNCGCSSSNTCNCGKDCTCDNCPHKN